MLLKLSEQQFSQLQSKLERSGISMGHRMSATHVEHRTFYQILSDLGFQDSRSIGRRASAPNYEVIGLDRAAGPPTSQEIATYSKLTDGAELPDGSFICQAILSDTDLVEDRYAVKTMRLLEGLRSKYLGRANDYNHSFDSREARSRIIQMGLGTDPDVKLHPDTPIEALAKLSPNNPFSGTYTALYGTLAFPFLNEDPEQTIDRVKNGMLKDISLAYCPAPETTYCSTCLLINEPKDSLMKTFWFWSYCEEHGFPGGIDKGGRRVVQIMDGVSDVLTFGLVSDGAVKRAGLVINPLGADTKSTEKITTVTIPVRFKYELVPDQFVQFGPNTGAPITPIVAAGPISQ